jgi:hypothetical protein
MYDPEMFYRGSNICHTARLPADETSWNGALWLVTPYDKGTELGHANGKYPEDKSMQLVFEQRFRQNCPVPLNKDYNFFYVRNHGWSH